MAKARIARGYTFKWGGNRVGSYATVTNGENDISVMIKGWLNSEFEKVARKNATHILVHRWSYANDGVPATFIIPRP